MFKSESQKRAEGRGKDSQIKDSVSGAGRRNKPIHDTRHLPAAIRRKFTPEEDQIIIQHVDKHGPGKWKNCADKLRGRNQKTVRQRWADELDPALEKGPLSEQEYFAMWVHRTRLKTKSWASMGKRMGRSPRVLKNKMAYFKPEQWQKMPEILEFALTTQGYKSESHLLDQLYHNPQLLTRLKEKLKDSESSPSSSTKSEVMLKDDEMRENTTFSVDGLWEEGGLGHDVEPKEEEVQVDVGAGWEDMMIRKKKDPVNFSLEISPPYGFRLSHPKHSQRELFCPLIRFTQQKRRHIMLTVRVQKINKIMLNHRDHEEVSEPQVTANDITPQ